MEFNTILDFVAQQGIWCALFVWLFYNTRQDSKKALEKAQIREDKLMACLNEQGKQLENITKTLDTINSRVDDIEEKISES